MRLSVRVGERIGTTAFFRNRPLIAAIFRHLERRGRKDVRVLVHACSIGAEVYSLIIHNIANRRGEARFNLAVEATDIEPAFLAHAAQGVYPADVMGALTPAERICFEPAGPGQVQVRAPLRGLVRFLPPASFTDFEPTGRYDVVCLLNGLVYVDADGQSRTIDRVAGYNDDLLAVTGFHPDRIEADIRRNGYAPVTDDIEAIHNAWTDRIGNWGFAGGLPPGVHVSPFLPPFSRVEGFEYRFCALFAKAGSAEA